MEQENEELENCLCRKCGREVQCEHHTGGFYIRDEPHILSVCGNCAE